MIILLADPATLVAMHSVRSTIFDSDVIDPHSTVRQENYIVLGIVNMSSPAFFQTMSGGGTPVTSHGNWTGLLTITVNSKLSSIMTVELE